MRSGLPSGHVIRRQVNSILTAATRKGKVTDQEWSWRLSLAEGNHQYPRVYPCLQLIQLLRVRPFQISRNRTNLNRAQEFPISREEEVGIAHLNRTQEFPLKYRHLE